MLFKKNKLAALLCITGLTLGANAFAGKPELKQLPETFSAKVYAMTNNATGNEINVYSRAENGTLSLDGSFSTGGNGGEGAENIGFRLADRLASQGSMAFSSDKSMILTVNAGSDEISVLRVLPNGLKMVDKVSSGGAFPVSIAVHDDLVYVLNGANDGIVTGFRMSPSGKLSPIEGSTRSLDAGQANPPNLLGSPAQISFSNDGENLIITEKASQEIDVFSVGDNGVLSEDPTLTIAQNIIPFGFAFDENDHLIMSEAVGTVSSYSLDDDGGLNVISSSVPNNQRGSCWVATNGEFAYITNTGSDSVSSFRISEEGALSLINEVEISTGSGPSDIALSEDGSFMYVVNSRGGTISSFEINTDGSLTSLGVVEGLIPEMSQGILAR